MPTTNPSPLAGRRKCNIDHIAIPVTTGGDIRRANFMDFVMERRDSGIRALLLCSFCAAAVWTWVKGIEVPTLGGDFAF